MSQSPSKDSRTARIEALNTRFTAPLSSPISSATRFRMTRIAPSQVELDPWKMPSPTRDDSSSSPPAAAAGAGKNPALFPDSNIYDAAVPHEGLHAPPPIKRAKVSAKGISAKLRSIVHDINYNNLCTECVEEQLLNLAEVLWEHNLN